MTLYSQYSDDDLIRLLRQDDISAFTAIHSRYYGVLYLHAYKRLSDRDTVKDILQELFIYLWDQRRSIEIKGTLQAYLCTAIRNKVLNVFKHEKVKSNYITSFINFEETCHSTTDENLRNKELIALVNAEVSTLPPKMRLVFELSRDSNLSHNEIAEKLEISPLTVRKQVNNSLKILRARLAPHFLLLLFLTIGICLGIAGS
ncbi:RNA polymerase sigma-70 factor [Mucilaginibacter sp. BT774]|uniref:RNA polymerase sigma-70 factor n=1 Tax=Mucilaginibacter sp. BT774 TaxID=3062276 RepID=UPI002674578E|nr:RNA polymerase sigma-70 factor [Mucilaginibacter sp. BT774]MDO3627510.1 RNA polymerase sigma-70 factor [Mucilaginibacter sp. BT774]